MIQIKNSQLYNKLISDKNILLAIYSLNSYIKSNSIIDKQDLQELIELNDPFNIIKHNEYIKKVKRILEEIFITDSSKKLKVQVYFKPKKVDEKGKVKYRPLHSASLINQITMVAMLNILMYEFDENGKIKLSDLSLTIPENFYGNIPDKKPKFLYKKWNHQYKIYSDTTTDKFSTYCKSKQYKYEVTLDIKNFFPSINPQFIKNKILSFFQNKNEDEIGFLKLLLDKLIIFEIDNLIHGKEKLTSVYNHLYLDNSQSIVTNKEISFLTRGLPQGLPQSGYLSNFCMMEIAKVYQMKNHFPGEHYFYCDDSVLYTNEKIDSDINFDYRIKNINTEINKIINKSLNDDQKNKYIIQVHRMNYTETIDNDDIKSSYLEMENEKYGQFFLNVFSRSASMATYDISKSNNIKEDIILYNKYIVFVELLEKEIKLIEERKESTKDIGYKKYLIRFKKFFSLRRDLIYFNILTDNTISEEEKLKLFNKLKSKTENKKLPAINKFFSIFTPNDDNQSQKDIVKFLKTSKNSNKKNSPIQTFIELIKDDIFQVSVYYFLKNANPIKEKNKLIFYILQIDQYLLQEIPDKDKTENDIPIMYLTKMIELFTKDQKDNQEELFTNKYIKQELAFDKYKTLNDKVIDIQDSFIKNNNTLLRNEGKNKNE